MNHQTYKNLETAKMRAGILLIVSLTMTGIFIFVPRRRILSIVASASASFISFYGVITLER